jgi:hypothetical protein
MREWRLLVEPMRSLDVSRTARIGATLSSERVPAKVRNPPTAAFPHYTGWNAVEPISDTRAGFLNRLADEVLSAPATMRNARIA